MGFKNWVAGRPNEGETQEQLIRRMSQNSMSWDMRITLPALVDLYDRIDHLERRIGELEGKDSPN